MQYFVYILRSRICSKFYSGQTVNFEKRLIRHNTGQTHSIRKCIPWKLVWHTNVDTRAEAMALERKIKARGAERFLADLGIIM